MLSTSFFLNFKIPNRIPVKSDQGTWLSEDPSTYMRDKARAVIKTKADSFNLSFDNTLADISWSVTAHGNTCGPKPKMIHMHKLNEESRQRSLESKAGHASRAERIDANMSFEPPNQMQFKCIITERDRKEKQQGNNESRRT